MFGYIVVNKPEMKIKDFERYNAYYCGICRSLKDRYGLTSEITLTYDSAFAAVLLSGLYEPDSKEGKCACELHPIKKRGYIRNELVDYVADMNLLLAYYKCIDDWIDDKSIVKLTYSKIIKNKVKKICKIYPEKVKAIKRELKIIEVLEKEESRDIDSLSNAFGRLMSEYFTLKEDEWKVDLLSVGFYIGKFIYILDAYDDYSEDVKKGKFNPFSSNSEMLDDRVKQLLMMSISEAARHFEVLPIVKEVDILRNIIYSGVWMKYYQIRQQREKEKI